MRNFYRGYIDIGDVKRVRVKKKKQREYLRNQIFAFSLFSKIHFY